MIRYFFVTIVMALLTVPAAAARLDPGKINNAEYRPAPNGKKSGARQSISNGKIDPLIVKAEVLLSRAFFSPGEIDGKLGENAQKALTAFAEARGLPSTKPLTPEIWKALTAVSTDPIITEYTISEKDIKGPFLRKLPAKMEQMQDIKSLGYTSPREAIAEKFHMSEELLVALNPGTEFKRGGEIILVVKVPDQATLPVERLEVDKSRQAVRAFDSSGKLIAFFPATVGSEEKPTPSGSLKVVSIHADPTYRYNPDYKFKGVKSRKPFTIAPGPNNPVGSFWIGLSAEGYGIHGTPEPSKISKSESHGCVRLTNWDARLLGGNVKKETPVVFVGEPQENSKSSAG
ncbi:MAG: L,D-transpeptidase family protein [Bradyrhizobium sp.]|jgi:lipoprotein-anchoring transpeptidase ErfK/SrfK